MKHSWKIHDGEVDMFVIDIGIHNGPGCEACGFTVCEHCERSWENLDDCPGEKINLDGYDVKRKEQTSG